MIYLMPGTRGRLSDVIGFKRDYNLKPNDTVIIMGNFGFIWDSTTSSGELALHRFMDKQLWNLAFIDGPYENHDRLDVLPLITDADHTMDLHVAEVGMYSNRIYHLIRGLVYLDSQGHRIFVMGGGHTVDAGIRKLGESWWPQEVPSKLDITRAMANLGRLDNTVHAALTYTTPSRAICKEREYDKYDTTREIIDELDKAINTRYWYYGQETHHNLDLETGRHYVSVRQHGMQLTL